MHTSVRPFATAGVALVGASAIAISPLVATPALPDVRVANAAVQLSAAVDPIEAWLQVFDTSKVNFADLANTWLQAPVPVVQQVLANQLGYLGELPDVEAIAGQIGTNIEAALTSLFAEDLSTLAGDHGPVYDLLLHGIPGFIPPVVPADLAPLVQFSTSYLSGVLLGLVGPVVGPVLALAASTNAIVGNLGGDTPDLEAAVNTLINTPAAMADAFLNGGQSVDITPLLKAAGLESPFPELDFGARLVFGGLLSPGGSIFNAMSIDLGDGSGPIGVGPGAIGSLIGLSQTIAKAIGWDGIGNSLAPRVDAPALRKADDTSVSASKTVTVQAVSAGDTITDDADEKTADKPATGETDSAATPAEPEADDVTAPTESGQETAAPVKTKPGVKRNDLGSQLKGAVKNATDRLNAIGAKLHNGPKKSSEAKADDSADSKTDSADSKTGTESDATSE